MDCLDQLVYHSKQGMYSEKNHIIAKCNNTWDERTLSRKVNHKENLLEVE